MLKYISKMLNLQGVLINKIDVLDDKKQILCQILCQ